MEVTVGRPNALGVRRIGLGTKRLLRTGGFSASDRARAVDLVRTAVDLGVDHLDTAAFYPTLASTQTESNDFTSLGCANELIREALSPYPEDVVIATKVGPTALGLPRPDELRGLVEENLRQLGREQLDLVYLRQAGLASVAEHFGALADLREAGLIRHLGLSNVRVEHLAQAQLIAPVMAVQNRYSVDFGRVNDALLTICGAQGIAFVPFFTLTAEHREVGGLAQHQAVDLVAAAHDAAPAQVRLAWALSQGDHVLVIPGTGSHEHLVENLAADDLRLSDEDVATLANG